MFKTNKKVIEKSIIQYAEGINDDVYSIPAFQRGYEWGRKSKKIFEFLYSVYKGYNLGTIVFWDSKRYSIARKENNLNTILSDDKKPYSYIIDGQQRTLTICGLFGTLDTSILGITASEIYVILNEEDNELQFSKHEPRNGIYITLNKFIKEYINNTMKYDFNDKFLDLISTESGQKKIQNFERHLLKFQNNLKAKDLIIGYKLQVPDDDLKEAIIQFEKINSAGIKLKEIDILDAMAYSDNKYQLKEKYKAGFNKFEGIVSNKSFSTDSFKIILNSYKILKNYTDNSTSFSLSSEAISDFKTGDSQILDKILKSYKNLISELQHMRLGSLKDMPYTHNAVLFIVLENIVAGDIWSKINKQNLLYEIMFQTGITKSYDKSASQKLIKHLNIIYNQIINRKNIYIDDMNRIDITETTILNTSYKTLGAFEKSILIFWNHKLNIKDYLTDEQVYMSGIFKKTKNLDHIFPLSKYNQYQRVHSFANISLLSAETNKRKLDKLPSSFFSGIQYEKRCEMYCSHFISKELYKQLADNQFETFINGRARLISQSINKEVKTFKKIILSK